MEQLSQCSFIVKLWQMLSDEDNFETLAWDESGESFLVRGSLGSIAKMLQKYFRHNKYSSFQRQLNYFGFQKTKNSEGTVIYHHKFFCLDRPKDVPKIKRKTNTGAREKMQKLGKRKLPNPVSPGPSLSQIAQLPQPKRVRCISPAQQSRIKIASLRDITNDSSKVQGSSSSRRSRRLTDIEESEPEELDDEGAQLGAEGAGAEGAGTEGAGTEGVGFGIFLCDSKEELEEELLQQNFFLSDLGFVKKIKQINRSDDISTMEHDCDDDHNIDCESNNGNL